MPRLKAVKTLVKKKTKQHVTSVPIDSAEGIDSSGLSIVGLDEISQLQPESKNKEGETENEVELSDSDIFDWPEGVQETNTPVTVTSTTTSVSKQETESKKLVASYQMPKIPPKISFEDLGKWVKKLGENQITALLVYLYRTYPIINREPKYIDKLSDPNDFTFEYLKTKHGGGRYRLDIYDTNKEKERKVSECRTEISIIDADPILVMSELDINDTRNKSYIDRLIALGKLRRDMRTGNLIDPQLQPQGEGLSNVVQDLTNKILQMGEKQQEMLIKQLTALQSAKATPGMEEQAISKAIDMTARGGERAMEMMSQIMKANQSDPKELITLVTSIAQLMKPAENNSTIEMLRLMMERSDKALQGQLEMMKLMMENKKEETSILDQAGKLKEVAEIFSGSSSGGSGKYALLETVMQNLPGVLGPIAQIIGGVMSMRGNAPNMGGMVNANPNPNPNPGTAMIPVHPNPMSGFEHVQQQQDINMNASNATNSNPNNPNQTKAMIMQYGGFILKALKDGKKGDVFAYDVSQLFGMEPILFMKQFTPEQVIGEMKQIPDFWQGVAHLEAPLTTFIGEFVSFDPDVFEAEGEE